MKDKLVSIVLPVYNGAQYLEISINGILNQTYKNWELIIVDDASSDATPDIISRYKKLDSRILSLRHEKNRNLPSALNSGFGLAKGDYLTWTACDDKYKPNAIAEMVKVLDKNPAIDLVYAGMIYMDIKGNMIGLQKIEEPENIAIFQSVGLCFLYRKKIQEKLGGYNVDLFCAEDLDFFQRAFAEFKFKPIYKYLFNYRIHDASLSSTKRKTIRKAGKICRAKNLPNLHFIPKNILAESYLRLTYLALLQKDMKTAIPALLTAMHHSPEWIIRIILNYLFSILNCKKNHGFLFNIREDVKNVLLEIK